MNANAQSAPLGRDPRFRRVAGILESLRFRALVAALLSGAGRVLVFWLGSIALRCLLDNWLAFAWSARAAFFVVDLVVIGWLARRFLIEPLRRRPDRSGAALRLQDYAPKLRSQVIATLQLVPGADAGQASRSLVERLLEETDRALARTDWKGAVPLKPAARWMAASVVMGLGLLAWGLSVPQSSSALLARYFLSTRPPPKDTRIEVLGGDLRAPRGGRVELLAEMAGEVPGEARFILSDAGGAAEPIRVEPEASAPHRFRLPVENLQESFRYRVEGGDARSRTYRVEVLDPPRLTELRFRVTPPAYTGIAPYEVSAGELRVIEGAELSLFGASDRTLAEAAAHFHREEGRGADPPREPPPSQALEVDGESISGDLGVPDTDISAVSVRLVGETGIASTDDIRHPVDWVRDAPPEPRIEAGPEDGASVAAGRPFRIEGRVAEDYGLESLRLRWSLGDSETARSLPLEADESGRFALDLMVGRGGARAGVRRLNAAPEEVVSWWIEAVDISALPRGPQVGSTPVRAFTVVTPERKIAELLGRVRENIGTLERAGEDQEEAGKRLRELIQSDNVEP